MNDIFVNTTLKNGTRTGKLFGQPLCWALRLFLVERCAQGCVLLHFSLAFPFFSYVQGAFGLKVTE